MSVCKLTLFGLWSFDNSLFDNLTLPEGIDKDVLIDNIMLRSGEFEVLYADHEFIKYMIGLWSNKWAWTFEHWVKALKEVDTFNPLENYDRSEEWHNTAKGKSKTKGDSLEKVTAYDSDQMRDRTENITDDNGESESEGTSTGRAHGNIGVTSLSQLFTEYQENTAVWNLYEHITDIFTQEFCIPVYE